MHARLADLRMDPERSAVGGRRRSQVGLFSAGRSTFHQRLCASWSGCFLDRGGPQYYMHGLREVHKARHVMKLRLGASGLNAHAFGGEEGPLCPCMRCMCAETTEHYLLDCPLYHTHRSEAAAELAAVWRGVCACFRQQAIPLPDWGELLGRGRRDFLGSLLASPPSPLPHGWTAVHLDALLGPQPTLAWRRWVLACSRFVGSLNGARGAYMADGCPYVPPPPTGSVGEDGLTPWHLTAGVN